MSVCNSHACRRPCISANSRGNICGEAMLVRACLRSCVTKMAAVQIAISDRCGMSAGCQQQLGRCC